MYHFMSKYSSDHALFCHNLLSHLAIKCIIMHEVNVYTMTDFKLD